MYKTYKLGDFLTESKIVSEKGNPDKRITVRLNMKGVEKRPLKKDVKGATKYFTRSKGQFIYGKQNLHKGAYGIIPENLDGYETTSDIPTFNLDESICLPEMLIYFFKKNDYYKTLEGIAKGVGSKRIHPAQIYELEIILPSITKQKEILNVSLLKEKNINKLLNIDLENQNYIKLLKQSILQEAIEGKLTKSWREKNKDIEPASVLLEKIKSEKEELIKQKKLKKQKELNPISEDEIPFEIPNSWEWSRLDDLGIIKGGKRIPGGSDFSESITGYKYLRVSDMKSYGVNLNNLKYIDERTYEILKSYTINDTDLYMTIVGGTIGKCGILPKECDGIILTENALKLTPIFISKYYIYDYLISSYAQNEFRDKTNQLGVQKLAMIQFKKTLFPLPPLSEQKEIVKKVDELMKLCDDFEKQTLETKENSENLMKAVLGEVFNK